MVKKVKPQAPSLPQGQIGRARRNATSGAAQQGMGRPGLASEVGQRRVARPQLASSLRLVLRAVLRTFPFAPGETRARVSAACGSPQGMFGVIGVGEGDSNRTLLSLRTVKTHSQHHGVVMFRNPVRSKELYQVAM
jgi:hypothetical protein